MEGDIEKKVPTTFEEAYQMSEAAYNQAQQETPAEVPAETAETVPAETAPATQQTAPPMSEAQIVTEAAMRAANELAAVKQENEQLKALMRQQSQAAEQNIEQTLLEPPVLDFGEYDYLTNEERVAKLSKNTQDTMNFALSNVDKKIQPVLSQYEQQQKATEEQAVLNDLRLKSPDIDTYLPEIQGFMGMDNAVAKALSAMPARERYVTGYLLAKGSAPAPQETAESLVKKIQSNPDAMRMLELQRVEKTKQNANIPPQSASSGMANIPVTPQQRPKSFDEAAEMVKQKYGY